MKQREIDLVDLLVEILLRWRIIILAMVIGAIAMGGLSYAKSYQTAQAYNARQNEEKDDTEGISFTEELTESQIVNVESVVADEKRIRDQKNYLDSSVWMNLDAMSLPRAEISLYIEGQDIANSTNLVQVYGDLVKSGEVANRVAEVLDISEKAAGELITVLHSVANANIYLGANTLRFVVYGESKDNCEVAMDEILAYLEEMQPKIAEVMGEHQSTALFRTFAVICDEDLLMSQNKVINALNTLQTNVASAKESFSEKEQAYYEFLMKEYFGEDMSDVTGVEKVEKTYTAGISKKYIVVGVFFGAFVCVLIVALKYVFSDKLHHSVDLRKMFGLPVIGRILPEEEKKKVLGFIDQWILKIRNHNIRVFSNIEATQLAASAIKIAALKEEQREIYCIGANMQEWELETADALGKILEQSHLRFVVLNKILYDAEALGKLEDAKSVVILETIGSTMYSELANELEILNRQNIRILGCVLLG